MSRDKSFVKCSYCNEEVITSEALNTHIQVHHKTLRVDISLQKPQLIMCTFCDYSCNLNIKLKRHIERCHALESKYSCDECQFTSNFVANIWEHTRQNHPSLHNFSELKTGELFIKLVAEQNMNIVEEMEQLKKDTKNAVLELAKSIDECFGPLKSDISEK